MNTAKDKVVASVSVAQAALEQALESIEHLPVCDVGALGFAAHALNNYLTLIDGTLELLGMELDDHPDAQVHQWIKGLKHTTSLMTHTAHQLMGGVSTEEASALVPMKWAFPMLLERLCRYYQRVADRKQIKIIRDIEFESPYVWSDPAAVGAAIDNLLSNALKFSASGTEVVVRLKPEQAHLVCSVEDTGPGLSLEDQKKLFRKGVRLSAKPTGGEPSTGYGLAVAKDLVEQVGGEIWCESTLGEGSCFFVRLPIYTEGMDDESRD